MQLTILSYTPHYTESSPYTLNEDWGPKYTMDIVLKNSEGTEKFCSI